MYVVIQEQVGAFSIQQEVVLVVRVSDFSIPSGITADILNEKGSMIVATAAGVPSETGAASADGLVWVSDATEILGGRWAAQSGGGGDIDLTNKSGSDQVAGTVVIHDADNDSSFKTTTTLRDRRVIGVLSEDIVSNASGKVAVAGKIVTVKVQGNVTRGQWLIASATEGRAQQDGYTRTPGVIGMALTSYAGGGAGTVSALIAVDMYLGASKGKGYCLGGFTTVVISNAQVLNFISETTSAIAGANLSAARNYLSGVSGGTDGYAAGGDTGAISAVVDKCAFATDITAAVAAMPAARRQMTKNVSGSLAGYSMGGEVPGVSLLADKTTFSTNVTAAQASANLSAARGAQIGGFASSTHGYALGGNTGAVSAIADKMPFATEITAAQASANLSAARYFLSGLIGSLAGYMMGGNGPSAVADKLTYSTDTTAAAAGANLPIASYGHASISTTNY